MAQDLCRDNATILWTSRDVEEKHRVLGISAKLYFISLFLDKIGDIIITTVISRFITFWVVLLMTHAYSIVSSPSDEQRKTSIENKMNILNTKKGF